MTSPLDWSHEIAEISDAGLRVVRTATPAERAALAAALALPSIEALEVTYRIEPDRHHLYRMTGRLRADLTQTCVVSLEPVAAVVEEEIDVVFVDQRSDTDDEASDAEEADREILSGPDEELIENGRFHVGQIVYEVLSAGLDPYPRKAGAEFDWTDAKAAAESAASNPFAVLKSLKRGD
ncbi:MAG: DUF177 domain-containing protein [Hyphomicrobium sp.]|nr:DUF177 domain-containing protein [Hyphomicrobium sp.]